MSTVLSAHGDIFINHVCGLCESLQVYIFLIKWDDQKVLKTIFWGRWGGGNVPSH